MVHCVIHLENNDRAVYLAGQLLKGTIELHVDQPKKFRGLYFTVYGAASCHWTETRTRTTGTGENRRTHHETVHFNGKDVYLNTKTYLFGASGAPAMEVQSGTHRYDFACQLPELLPASFDASHGHIRYYIEAVLDIPWSFDKEFKLQFTVVRNDDLNNQPHLRIPCKSEEIKHFCCLFCQSEPLMMTVTLPCSGFTPGQSIHMTVDYHNKSDVQVVNTVISLQRVTRFTSDTPQTKMKYEHESMVELYLDQGCNEASSATIEKDLVIPRILMSSNNSYCRVVQVTYELKVKGISSGCNGNIKMSFPITIGSVPLSFHQTTTLQAPHQNNFVIATAPMSNGHKNNLVAPTSMPELPPPSFNEAIKMGKHQEAESSSLLQPQQNVGWNVAGPPLAPSAPSETKTSASLAPSAPSET